MDSKERISAEALNEFAMGLLEKVGADNEQGRIFSKALIWSDLIGRPTHGIWRLPAYIRRLEKGLMKCPCQPVFSRDRQAVALLDGDAGIGHYIGHLAMKRAIDKAGHYGIGAVGVCNSNHFGTGAYYVDLAARQGMIGIAVSNSLAKVAPCGGNKAVLGTNPFAFATPGEDEASMMFDMATTVMAGSQVMKLAEAGEQLPEGVAVDRQGKPVRDPNRVDDAVLLPFGHNKGFGIALMVEILSSVLTGSSLSLQVNSMFSDNKGAGGNGHFFIAIDIGRFVPVDEFLARSHELFATVRDSGSGSVRIPGEIRWQQYRQNLRHGIPLDKPTSAALNDLAWHYGLAPLSTTTDPHVRPAPDLAARP